MIDKHKTANVNQVSSLKTIQLGPHIVASEASDELIKILLQKGNEVRTPENDFTKKLAGRIKHEYTYGENTDWFVSMFHDHVANYLRTTPWGSTRKCLDKMDVVNWELSSLWINYQKSKEYNPPHNHLGDLSFIIYPKIPKDISKETSNDSVSPGNIVFEYGDKHFSQFLSFNNVGANIEPYDGLIIIFPAWLSHHVYAFESDVERVSVSGNIKIKHDFLKITEN